MGRSGFRLGRIGITLEGAWGSMKWRICGGFTMLLAVLIFSLPSQSYAQDVFQRLYFYGPNDTPNEPEGAPVVQAPDGGYVIAGDTRSLGLIVKLDRFGDSMWCYRSKKGVYQFLAFLPSGEIGAVGPKSYIGDNFSHQTFLTKDGALIMDTVLPGPNGAIAVDSQTFLVTSSGVLRRLSPSGAILAEWEHPVHVGQVVRLTNQIIVDSDSLFALNEDFSERWSRPFNFYTSDSVGYWRKFLPSLRGDGFVLWSDSAGISSDHRSYAVRCDSDGNVHSVTPLGFFSSDHYYDGVGDLAIASNDDCLISGRFDHHFSIARIHLDGTISWLDTFAALDTVYGGPNFWSEGVAVASTMDGGVIALGRRWQTGQPGSSLHPGIWVVKTDSLGNTDSLSFGHSGVARSEDPSAVEISPNPTDGVVSIHAANVVHVTVENLLGVSVLERAATRSPDFPLDLTQQPAGVYYLRITLGTGEVRTIKLVKE